MKEEIVDKLMEKALTYLSSAEAFIGENVPKFIEELLSFKIFEHGYGVFIGLLGLTACLVGLFLLKKVWTNPDYCTDTVVFFSFFGGGLILITTIFSCSAINENLVKAYKAYKAPRVYLVDYFKGQK